MSRLDRKTKTALLKVIASAVIKAPFTPIMRILRRRRMERALRQHGWCAY